MNRHSRRKIFKSVMLEETATAGMDIVTEGDFSVGGAAWTLVNCSVVGGKLVFFGLGEGGCQQSTLSVLGRRYRLTYRLSEVVSGSIEATVASVVCSPLLEDGSFEFAAAEENGDLYFSCSADFSGKLDNIICEELPTMVSLPLGTQMCAIRPQGICTIKLDDSDIAINLAANEFSDWFHFNADGVTTHTITLSSLTGSDCTCFIHCLIDPDICPSEESE